MNTLLIQRTGRRTGARSRRGFSLLAVIVIMAVLVGGLLAILHDAGIGLKQHGTARSRELINGAMEFGLNDAMQSLQRLDPDLLVRSLSVPCPFSATENQFDIFRDWANCRTFSCGAAGDLNGDGLCDAPNGVMTYPLSGPNTGELRIRVGARLGQKTQAPSGEDVTSSYGYVVEILVAVSKNTGIPDASERAVFAVRLPHTFSHSN